MYPAAPEPVFEYLYTRDKDLKIIYSRMRVPTKIITLTTCTEVDRTVEVTCKALVPLVQRCSEYSWEYAIKGAIGCTMTSHVLGKGYLYTKKV